MLTTWFWVGRMALEAFEILDGWKDILRRCVQCIGFVDYYVLHESYSHFHFETASFFCFRSCRLLDPDRIVGMLLSKRKSTWV